MKRRIKSCVKITALVFAVFLLFSGCGKPVKDEAPVPETIKQGFSCDAKIRYGDMDLTVKVSRPGLQECIVEVIDPPPLDGLKMHWQGEDMSMSYKGLSLDLIDEMFPDTAFAGALNNVFNSLAAAQSLKVKEEDGRMTFSGTGDSGGYSVTMNMQTGQLESISVPSLGLDVDFIAFSSY
ncbi:MAG TPA: hypothetical protein DEQ02_00420 [Ruminococcaceae bacterium]|nr:hypothetical protein [Oscillospiraceae bacterium]